MYTDQNFKTKKAFRNAVAEGKKVTIYQPNDMFGINNKPLTGEFTVEGPHYPEPHRWYARVKAENGVVVKVLS